MTFKKLLAGLLASAMTLSAGIFPNFSPTIQTEMTASAEESPGIKIESVTVPEGTSEVELGIYLVGVTECKGTVFSVTCSSPLKFRSITNTAQKETYDNYINALFVSGKKYSTSEPIGTLVVDISGATSGYYSIDLNINALDDMGASVADPVAYNGTITIEETKYDPYDYRGIEIESVTVPYGTRDVELNINFVGTGGAIGGELTFIYDNPIWIKRVNGAASYKQEEIYEMCAIFAKGEPMKSLGTLSVSISEDAEPGKYPIRVLITSLHDENGEIIKNPISYNGVITIEEPDPLCLLQYDYIDSDNDGLNDSIEITGYDDTMAATAVVIPEKIDGLPVTSIKGGAFAEARIIEITIPDSVTSIGDAAFTNCESLESITIPNGVTSIGDLMFQDCFNLKSIYIPDSVTSIGYGAFYWCESLESIIIPNSVTSIGESAFSYCEGLKSVTIPNSVANIGSSAFFDCKNLKSVIIPDSVTSIGYSPFGDCSNLESINVSENNTYYTSKDGVLFDKDITELIDYPIGNSRTTYIIPDSVTSIGDGAFCFCESLKSVTIPNSVTSIGLSAFSCCESLESVTIPDSVTSIGKMAFNQCVSLENVTIPDSVTSIGERAFSQCVSLENVTILDSVTNIEAEMFEYCTNLKSVTIPDSVTSIGDGAFYWCESLESITIPDSVTSIGNDAFYKCYSLTSITIPDSVTNIGKSAFYGCQNLKSITILNPDCEIYDNEHSISNGFDSDRGDYFDGTIYGYEDSTAWEYAEKYGYNFESLGEYVKTWKASDVRNLQRYLMRTAETISQSYDLNGDDEINVFDNMLLRRKLIYG